jgi:hypothetical protein
MPSSPIATNTVAASSPQPIARQFKAG